MKYTVIIEQDDLNFGAYVPDLPGCIAVGESKKEVLELIKESIEFHIEALMDDGITIPKPQFDFAHIDVNAA